MKKVSYLYIVILVGTAFINTGCKKPLIYSKGNLSFSKDTVVFDTVFTTIGSTTQRLKIYNTDSRTITIDQIQLMGGANSPFRINVDGINGTEFGAIEIEGKDSLFTFIEVTLDPNGGTLPMVIEDSIRFRTNGRDQYVLLAAWGQDVYYHYSSPINGIYDLNSDDINPWANDKPHLIYGAAFIDEGKTLTIPAGTQIYMHKNAFLYCYKGTLNIEGQLGNEVVIQGDRLESAYDDVTGQFYGVYLDSASTSSIDYMILRNGITGVHIEGDGENGSSPTLQITNSIIENCARYGILNFYGGKLIAENCLIYKSGFHAFSNLAGSSFNFNYCSLLGYGSGEEQLPAVGIRNYYESDVFPLDATITNSVIYGLYDNEFIIDTADISGAPLNFNLHHLVMKQATSSMDYALSSNIYKNQDPLFKNIEENDFEFWSGSPLNSKGDPLTPTSNGKDLRGIIRSLVSPDIGAIEIL